MTRRCCSLKPQLRPSESRHTKRANREQSLPQPVVLGFTPINHPQALTAQTESIEHNPGDNSSLTPKGRGKGGRKALMKEKKRKTEPSSKPAGPKKPRKAKPRDRSKDYDISKNLQRTKPAQAGHGMATKKSNGFPDGVASSVEVSAGTGQLRVEEELPAGDISISKTQRNTDHANVTQAQPQGLAERYQAAYGVANLFAEEKGSAVFGPEYIPTGRPAKGGVISSSDSFPNFL